MEQLRKRDHTSDRKQEKQKLNCPSTKNRCCFSFKVCKVLSKYLDHESRHKTRSPSLAAADSEKSEVHLKSYLKDKSSSSSSSSPTILFGIQRLHVTSLESLHGHYGITWLIK